MIIILHNIKVTQQFIYLMVDIHPFNSKPSNYFLASKHLTNILELEFVLTNVT